MLLGFYINDIKKPIYSKENNINEEFYSEYIKNLPNIGSYILGPGDKLQLSVSEDAIDLEQIFTIDGEGITKLKRLDNIFVKGLTIRELINVLNYEYKKYVIEPDVELVILEYRPIKVYIDGEVDSPGLYVLEGSLGNPNEVPPENLKGVVDVLNENSEPQNQDLGNQN